MKYLFLFTIFLLSLSPSNALSIHQDTPTGENEFWTAYAKSDFETASEISEKLSDSIPDYLMLSAICDLNLYRYASYQKKSNRYHVMKNLDYSSLKALMEKNYVKDRHEIDNLMGIVQFIVPRIELGSAREFFERSISLEPYNPHAYNFLALTYMREGKYDKTIENAEKSISMDPFYPAPYGAMAFAMHRKGNVQGAIDKLLECMVTCPVNTNDTYANYIRITCNFDTVTYGDTTLLAPGFRTDATRDHTLNKLKGHNRPLYELAFQFHLFAGYAEADSVLKAISVDSTIQTRYYYLYCLNAYSARDTVRFREGLLDMVRVNEVSALLDLGSYFFQEEDPGMAMEILTLAEPLPASKQVKMKVLSNIGAIHAKQKRHKEAVKYYRKALRKDREDVITLTNMGIAFHRLEKDRKARKAFLKAAQYNDSDRQARTIDYWLKEVEKPGE